MAMTTGNQGVAVMLIADRNPARLQLSDAGRRRHSPRQAPRMVRRRSTTTAVSTVGLKIDPAGSAPGPQQSGAASITIAVWRNYPIISGCSMAHKGSTLDPLIREIGSPDASILRDGLLQQRPTKVGSKFFASTHARPVPTRLVATALRQGRAPGLKMS